MHMGGHKSRPYNRRANVLFVFVCFVPFVVPDPSYVFRCFA